MARRGHLYAASALRRQRFPLPACARPRHMKQAALVIPAATLALAALLVMFTPLLRDFTTWHIDGAWLAGSAFVLGLAICLSLLRIRTALLSVLVVIVLASL